MLESLAPKAKRPENILNFVAQLQSQAKIARDDAKGAGKLSEAAAYDSILGSFSWLKVDSISQSITRLVDESCGGLLFQGMSPSKFFQKCYKVRSDLTHSGKTYLSANEFAVQLVCLRSLCLAILRHVIDYVPLRIPEEALAPPFFDAIVQIT
jgi:hypothetical protein